MGHGDSLSHCILLVTTYCVSKDVELPQNSTFKLTENVSMLNQLENVLPD